MDTHALPLGNGGITLIDAHMLEIPLQYNFRDGSSMTAVVAELNWCQRKNRRFFYAFATVTTNYKKWDLSLSRLLTQCPSRMIVDHKNKDTLDNRLHNLRVCTIRENTANMHWDRTGCASQYRGVRKAGNRWQAQINFFDEALQKKRCTSIGSFDTEEEAARAWDAAARQYRGEFAYQNFK